MKQRKKIRFSTQQNYYQAGFNPVIESGLEASFLKTGYSEMQDSLPAQDFFDLLYQSFDTFIDLVQNDPILRLWLEKCADDWHAIHNNQIFYSNIPQKFVDRTVRADKSNKVYFQCCLDFIHFMEANVSEIYIRFPEVKVLHTFFKVLHFMTESLFAKMVRELAEHHTSLREIFYQKGRPLPILLKTLRYNGDEDFATKPHVDKSALTLILNNTDKMNENLIVAPHGIHRISQFHRFKSKGENHLKATTSAIAMPGMCLEAIGYKIPPSPHAVLPAKQYKYRHSVIAFLLVPNLALEELQTSVPFVSDVNLINA